MMTVAKVLLVCGSLYLLLEHELDMSHKCMEVLKTAINIHLTGIYGLSARWLLNSKVKLKVH